MTYHPVITVTVKNIDSAVHQTPPFVMCNFPLLTLEKNGVKSSEKGKRTMTMRRRRLESMPM